MRLPIQYRIMTLRICYRKHKDHKQQDNPLFHVFIFKKLFHRSHSYPVKVCITGIMFFRYATAKQSYFSTNPFSNRSCKGGIYFFKVFSVYAITKMAYCLLIYLYSKIDRAVRNGLNFLYLFRLSLIGFFTNSIVEL